MKTNIFTETMQDAVSVIELNIRVRLHCPVQIMRLVGFV